MERPKNCPICDRILDAPNNMRWCCEQVDHRFDSCHYDWIFCILFIISDSQIQIKCRETNIVVEYNFDTILEQNRSLPSFEEAIEILTSCKNNLMFV